jgi:hypothetical protein
MGRPLRIVARTCIAVAQVAETYEHIGSKIWRAFG